MYRKQLLVLNKWLSKSRRKPLIIRGARQVGKSTLVRLFSGQVGVPLVEINLERYQSLNDSFESLDIEAIINDIESLPNTSQISAGSILFLDEIQSTPNAIPALRYFYEDEPNIPVISAGSLLEFTLADHNFSMPVGRVEYLHMGPMTFTEFLIAIDEKKLAEVIENFEFDNGDEKRSIGLVAHKRLLKLVRIYCFVGGMPEAVLAYRDTKKLSEVSEIHNSIIETYRDDFPKYAGSRNLTRLLNVFNYVARNVGQKIKYSNISREDQSSTIKKDIELLCLARIVFKVVHSHCSGLPLQADLEEKRFKLMFLDVGLMNAVSGLGWNTISKLDDISLINEGGIAEQFVAQHLQACLSSSINRELTYWLREGKSSNAEVDFVVSFEGQITPIEVKSGAKGSMKSLHQFMGEKEAPFAVRIDTNPPSKQLVDAVIQRGKTSSQVSYDLLSIPLYLVEKLPDIIKHEVQKEGS